MRRHWFPNSTAVVVIDGTVHLADDGRAVCGAKGGRPSTLVQVRTYMSVQWHAVCFPKGRP